MLAVNGKVCFLHPIGVCSPELLSAFSQYYLDRLFKPAARSACCRTTVQAVGSFRPSLKACLVAACTRSSKLYEKCQELHCFKGLFCYIILFLYSKSQANGLFSPYFCLTYRKVVKSVLRSPID